MSVPCVGRTTTGKLCGSFLLFTAFFTAIDFRGKRDSIKSGFSVSLLSSVLSSSPQRPMLRDAGAFSNKWEILLCNF